MLTTIYNSLCKYPRSQESFTPPQVVFLRDFLPCMESKMAWDSTLRRDTENWCLARRFWHGEVGFLFFWKESCFSPKQQKHFYISTFLMDPQDHKIHRFHRTWILHPMRGSKYVLMLKKMVRNATHCCTELTFTFILKFGVSPCGKLTPCHEMFKKVPQQCMYIFYLYIVYRKTFNEQSSARMYT